MAIELKELEEDMNKFVKVINELGTRATQLQQDLDNVRNTIIANNGALQQTQNLIRKIVPSYFEPKEEEVKKEEPSGEEKVAEKPKKRIGKKSKIALEDKEEEIL